MDHLNQHNDQTLVQLYMSGTDEAFDALLSRYGDRLYTYIYYNVQDEDRANDIFQETFVKVITTLQQGRYTETGKFYPWLIRVAHNLIVDFYRTERSEQAWICNETEDKCYAAALHDPVEESPTEKESTLEAICKLLDLLPENQKEIIQMRFYQNLTFKEIAQAKGMSINTALGRMRYAILNMRRLAGEHHLLPHAN